MIETFLVSLIFLYFVMFCYSYFSVMKTKMKTEDLLEIM